MLIGVVNAGKAAGSTTVATGLGAAFGSTGQHAIVIEADVSGGDLAYVRPDLNAEAGVLGFAAAMGADTDERQAAAAINDHSWTPLAGSPNCAVMPLTAGGPGVELQIEALWSDGAWALRRWPGPVLLDLGRWGHGLTKRIWSDCDLGVVVCSGSLAGLRRLDATWTEAPLRNSFATWRILNGSPWDANQIQADTGLTFEAELSWDRRGAEQIRLGNWKAVKRRHLARQLQDLAGRIGADREGVASR